MYTVHFEQHRRGSGGLVRSTAPAILGTMIDDVTGSSPRGSIELEEVKGPFDCETGRASYSITKQGNRVVPRVYTHANRLAGAGPNCIPLHAYLWTVEDELDLTPIKAHGPRIGMS